MRKAAVVGALIVGAAAAVSLAWPQPETREGNEASPAASSPPAARSPTPAELRGLQAKADAACLCSRQPGKALRDPGCWAGFERDLARFEHSEGATMCLDESVALACFPPFDDFENCVFRERAYRACSEEEAARKRAEARARGQKGCGA